MEEYDVIVIGGGPGGLSASLSAKKEGAKVLLLDREEALGGILKQCIHDGFGLEKFKTALTGPEYTDLLFQEVKKENVRYILNAYVSKVVKDNKEFILSVSSPSGMKEFKTKAVVFATGCRERSAKNIFINGDRPSGVFTAGSAQHFVNRLGVLPGKNVVILGSGDIGLIMARRLTLEGANVLGVYEAKSTPSGLQRNIHQCLLDYNIPLYLSKTVTRCFGDGRLEKVEIMSTDEHLNPIKGTEEYISCDTLIISVGLIPENELLETLNVKMDGKTKGPEVDQNNMTSVDGVFSTGNSLLVFDLADYVSESAEKTGKAAAKFALGKKETSSQHISVTPGENLMFISPERIINPMEEEITLFFRSKDVLRNAILRVKDGEEILFKKKYITLRPPEMERLTLPSSFFENRKNIEIDLDGEKYE